MSKDEAVQIPKEFYQLMDGIKKRYRKKLCLHPACSSGKKIVSAHSLSVGLSWTPKFGQVVKL